MPWDLRTEVGPNGGVLQGALSSYQGFVNQDDFLGSKEHGGNRQDCGTNSHLISLLRIAPRDN
jgi:hypothetical protein